MTKTKIEWADTVWNPTVGCSKVSEGCRNCYAERMANRLQAMGRPEYPGLVDDKGHWTGKVNCVEKRLEEPLHWKKPRRVFVNSMSDLFHEAVPDSFINKAFAMMALCPQHTFLVLTKRPVRMKAWFHGFVNITRADWVWSAMGRLLNANRVKYPQWPLPNVWLGVSVENQQTADERIPYLLKTPAQIRFVSCEPLLGPIILRDHLPEYDPTHHYALQSPSETDKLDWVICGGESGPGARPMHPDWARSLRDQCKSTGVGTGVPFFFKQWGEWLPVAPQYGDDDLLDKLDMDATSVCLGNKGTIFSEEAKGKQKYWCGFQPYPDQEPWFIERVGKKAAGRFLDGREWNEVP